GMSDELRRIAMDGSQKIPVRIVPAIITERAAGRLPRGAARALAAWIAHLRGIGAPFNDARGESWRETAAGEFAAAAERVLNRLGIGGDPALLEAVVEEYLRFGSHRDGRADAFNSTLSKPRDVRGMSSPIP